MATSEILNSYNAAELKRIIRATNITGYSKLKKPELIKLMLRPEHVKRFSSIRHRDERTGGKSATTKTMKLKKSVLNNLKKKYPKYKAYIEFYEKSGFTKPKDLPPPPSWMLSGSGPPSDFKVPPSVQKRITQGPPPPPPGHATVKTVKVMKTQTKKIKEPKPDTEPKGSDEPPKPQTKKDRLDEAEGKKSASKPKSQSVASRLDEAEGKKKGQAPLVSRTIREQHPQYVKGMQSLIKKGVMPESTGLQKRRFLNLLEINKGLDGDDDKEELEALDQAIELIEDDDDSLAAYNFLFGKLNLKTLENRYVDLIIFLLGTSKNKLGRSALNEAPLNIQKKIKRKNKEVYMKFVSTAGDKTGEKQKLADKDLVQERKKQKQFQKDLAEKKKKEAKEEKDKQIAIEELKKKKYTLD